MRRAPALNIPLKRVPERQGASRNVVPPLVTVVEARNSPSGEGVKRNLAVRRSSKRLDLPTVLIAYDLAHSRRPSCRLTNTCATAANASSTPHRSRRLGTAIRIIFESLS